MKRFLWLLALVLLLAASWVRLPYYGLGPGPAREVQPLMTVRGHPTYTSSGKYIMTTVSYFQLTAVRLVTAWLDPDVEVVKERELFAPGTTQEQQVERALSDMDQSKIDATAVALRPVTRYPKVNGDGVLIEGVAEGCPAYGKLAAGDLIIAINGKPTDDLADARDVLDSLPDKKTLKFEVTAAGETHVVRLTRKPCFKPRTDEYLVGITMIESFPFPVSISSGSIGGPSAGMMYALGLYDLLTPGDLTKGEVIAGTGTISLDGKVGPIGGITDKVIAAERAGAGIFLVPKDNLKELRNVETGSMEVVPVSSFREALRYLRSMDRAEV